MFPYRIIQHPQAGFVNSFAAPRLLAFLARHPSPITTDPHLEFLGEFIQQWGDILKGADDTAAFSTIGRVQAESPCVGQDFGDHEGSLSAFRAGGLWKVCIL